MVSLHLFHLVSATNSNFDLANPSFQTYQVLLKLGLFMFEHSNVALQLNVLCLLRREVTLKIIVNPIQIQVTKWVYRVTCMPR